MKVRRVFRLIFNRRAKSAVIFATILTGVAIALGFAVLAWVQMR